MELVARHERPRAPRGRRRPASTAAGVDLDVVSEVLATVRRAKTEAKQSQRARSPRSTVAVPAASRPALEAAPADLVDALTVVELDVVDGAELAARRSSSPEPHRARPAGTIATGSRFAGSWPRRDRRPPRTGRTWPERLAIAGTIVAAVVCFLAAGSLVAGYIVVRNREVVEHHQPGRRRRRGRRRPRRPSPAAPTTTAAARSRRRRRRAPTTPPETFPPADPEAKNFLLTGADNGACVDPNSPYAPAFGDAESGRVGERSDTIMVFRVDPAADRVAVLSFPRDLYVTIADSGNKGRINSAYRRDDPQRLIDTIYENFGIGIDHYIQVDFCTFKTLVDAVGGVTVPFAYPARDPQHRPQRADDRAASRSTATTPSPTSGRATTSTRTRPAAATGRATRTSDLGRISRQQDFLRRTLSSVLAKGLLNPSVARGLISAATGGNVVTDDQLTLAKLMEFAGVLRDVEPDEHPLVPDRGDGPDDQRHRRARAADRRREHAGRAGDVPRRDVARRCAGAVVRADDGGADARRRRRHRRRPTTAGDRRPPPATSAAAADRPARRTTSASSRPRRHVRVTGSS